MALQMLTMLCGENAASWAGSCALAIPWGSGSTIKQAMARPSSAVVFAVLGLGALGVDSATRSAYAIDLSFPNFSDLSAWQLNGDASQAGNQLRVVPAQPGQAGSAFVKTSFVVTPYTSFSSSFQFQITNPGGSCCFGADGLMFAMASAPTSLGIGGGGIGYQGIPANSLGVEFDTFNNGTFDDSSSNHIAVNTQGNLDPPLRLVTYPTPFIGGNIFSTWIDYDSIAKLLDVRVSPTNLRPASPTLSQSLDLYALLQGQKTFVGFTAGTGGGNANHSVLNFAMSTREVPGPMPIAGAAAAFALSKKLKRRIQQGKAL